MVQKSVIPGLITLFLLTCTAGAQWIQTGGPTGGRVISSTISGDTVFAGFYKGGLYRSTDKGIHWAKADSGFETGDVDALLMYNGKLFAATDTPKDNGVIRCSFDYGKSWVKSDSGIKSISVMSFAESEGKIYAATNGDGILVSTDTGKSWNTLDPGYDFTFYSIVARGDSILVASGLGVHRSTDGGTTWTVEDSGFERSDKSVRCLAAGNGRIFAGTVLRGMFFSDDYGVSWTPVDPKTSGLPKVRIQSIIISGDSVFALTDGGIYRSSDNGTTWSWISAGLFNRNISTLAVNGETVVAGTYGGGIYRYNRADSSWNAMNTGIVHSEVRALASYKGRLFAGTYGGGVLYSADNGENWTEFNTGNGSSEVIALAVDDSTVWMGTANGNICRSVNGEAWKTSYNNSSSNGFLSLAVVDACILAGAISTGIVRKEIAGGSWTNASTELGSTYVNSFANADGMTFAATGRGIYRSNDCGASWTRENKGLGDTTTSSLAIIDTTVIAGVRSGMYRSGIKEIRWREIDFDRVTILAMATYRENLFAATTSAIYLSTDLGENWKKVSTGFSTSAMNALAIHNGFLFAGTHEKGVWRRPISEISGIKKPDGKHSPGNTAHCVMKLVRTFPSVIAVDLFQPHPGRINADLYNASGKKVYRLFDGHVAGGTHRYHMNTSGLSKGAYLLQVRMTDASFNKMVHIVY